VGAAIGESPKGGNFLEKSNRFVEKGDGKSNIPRKMEVRREIG